MQDALRFLNCLRRQSICLPAGTAAPAADGLRHQGRDAVLSGLSQRCFKHSSVCTFQNEVNINMDKDMNRTASVRVACLQTNPSSPVVEENLKMVSQKIEEDASISIPQTAVLPVADWMYIARCSAMTRKNTPSNNFPNNPKRGQYTMQGIRRVYDVDMTSGNIFMILLRFTLPLFVGNLFQQFYNIVDTWVVGNYVSSSAYSAVGTVTPIINMLIGAFNGLSNGAGVVISQYYGAKDVERVRESIHTSMTFMLPLGIGFTAIGIAMTPAMLRLMKTPPEILPEATSYLVIYFAGMLGLVVYNMGASVLRAVGDSKRPFYYLVFCTVLNITLDLVLVLEFDMGVQGVAYATVAAQTISAALVVFTMMRSDGIIKLELHRLKMEPSMLKKIIRVGFPAALQMALTSFSNVIVQSYINVFGADCMGGWTTYNKVDQLIFLPMKTIALSISTFVGQNLGCKQEERAKKGIRVALWMSITVTLFITGLVVLRAPAIVRFFNDKAEVVTFGTLFLRVITPFMAFCSVNQIYAGALRGAGNSRAPMIIMLSSFVLFRQIYLYIMANFISNQILPIALGYPAGWIVCSIAVLIYYKRTSLTKYRLIEDETE